jgi:hypothetical protein
VNGFFLVAKGDKSKAEKASTGRRIEWKGKGSSLHQEGPELLLPLDWRVGLGASAQGMPGVSLDPSFKTSILSG